MAFWKLFSRRRRYEDVSVSIQEHLAERAEELMEEGVPRAEAERRARREFGNVTLVEQRSREAWQWPTIESILADVRFAVRQLVKVPGFTVTAVLTLALGIAVNATMFSMVSAFLMPHIPGRDPQRVVVVSAVSPYDNFLPDTYRVSAPNYESIRADRRVFADTAAMWNEIPGSLGGKDEQPEAIQYEAVTPNYFGIFGVSPELGRGLQPGEDQPGRDHVVVISHALWARRYSSNPAIVGKSIRLNREDYTVVGVMGADFRLMLMTPQLWTPLTLTPADQTPDARRTRKLMVLARLAPGVTVQQADAEAKRLAAQAAADYPQIDGRWGASVRILKDYLVHDFHIAQAMAVMMTAVGLVLLIACANVSGLLLTRAAGRQKELAIRASLGASRWRIVRQLFLEGLTIALLGGAAGLGLTWGGVRLMRSLLTFTYAIATIPIRLDEKVLLFAMGATLLAALFSSVAPAVKASRTDLNADLRSEGRAATAGRNRNRMRAVLVGSEIAMALFLLCGTGLLTRGVYSLDHQRLGFREDHLLTAGLLLDGAKYPDGPAQARFVHDLLSRLHLIPGLEDVAVTSNMPATGAGKVPVHIDGIADPPPSEPRRTETVVVTPEFFAASGIAALRGRTFTDHDDVNAPRVAVVNQRFMQRYLGEGDAVGRRVKLEVAGTPQWDQIVGVVADVKSYSEETRVDPLVYEPFAQRPANQFSVMLRGQADPDSMIAPLRQTVAALDAELPLMDVMSMERVIDQQRNGDPVFVEILGTFAGLALLLSAIGIYGLIAYSVRQRTQEFGIRVALGANARDIAGMVLREGILVAAIGSAIGLVLALPLGRGFDAMFPGIHFSSPGIYPAVLLVMIVVAVGATLAPARRAMKVDPTAALRIE